MRQIFCVYQATVIPQAEEEAFWVSIRDKRYNIQRFEYILNSKSVQV